jgi:opacity protein-like surface antigen
MVGARFRILSLAALCLLAANAAQAADYTPPPQQPVYVPPPALQECCSNWYLRGDVGIGINGKYKLDYEQNPLNSSDFAFTHSDIDDAFFLGGGVGYYFNNWLRFDVTGEYRAKARVYAYGSYTPTGGGSDLDIYQGYLSSWVFLANAYVDLGTWYCLTPFVGVGIGGAYNTLSDFTDIGPQTGGNGVGRNPSSWNLAWALHAGVAYNVSKNFKVELSYRYLNYGSITDTVDCVGGCNPDSYKFDKLSSQDIMLSLRWSCCELQAPTPPPQYVYQPPPPVYTPPSYTPLPAPLRSRG